MSSKIIGQHYKVFFDKKLGEGSFGKVYLCLDTNTGKFYAAKTEERETEPCLLETESSIINYVNQKVTEEPTIKCYWYGGDDKQFYLITDLLGPSLESLMKSCGGVFTLKTTLMIGEQLLSRIRFYHDRNILHRDIKPNNILIEYTRPQRSIYLIDFGLAKKYRKSQTNEHIPYKEGKPNIGTARYMSVNAHEKRELSRRDDMYSIGYVLLYFITGKLPWQGLGEKTKKKQNQRIHQIKKALSNADLTAGLSCDKCKADERECSVKGTFLKYFDYLDTLGFDSDVNYNYLIKLLLVCMEEHGYRYDYKWDWLRVGEK